MLRNGKSYDPSMMDGMEVIDENIVRHSGMTRLPSRNKTPFQILIENLASDPSFLIKEKKSEEKISEEKIEIKGESKQHKCSELAHQLFHVPSLKSENRLTLFSSNDESIIDAYNDNTRRFFESLFAKKILISVLNSEHINKTSLLIKEMTSFLADEYKKQEPQFLLLWEKAKEGKEVENDDLNNSFRVFRPDLVNLIKEDHFQNHNNKTILELYDLHYLTHRISQLKSYQEQHPEGIVEIYDNKYKKRNKLFLPLNRGRLSNFGFNKDNSSSHLGIFRSIDRVPHDMRKSVLTSNATRCPDRLYMEHPRIARPNLNSWLHHCFSNSSNSCYVNGLSGSILIEIRSILFFISSIMNKSYACKFIKEDILFEDNYALLKDYFLLVIGLFVYFEGGHTFSEILSVFDLKDVAQCIDEIFKDPKEKNILSSETLLMENKKVMQLLKESLRETIQFYSVSQHKNKVCNEIQLRFK